MEIQLPDYLPSRYKNWLDVYLECAKVFSENGWPINEESKVKMYDMGSYEEQQEMMLSYGEHATAFFQELPLTLIKARALDYILPNIPTLETMYKLRSNLYYSRNYSADGNDRTIEVVDKLMNICPKEWQLFH